jgi:hypothetical protein
MTFISINPVDKIAIRHMLPEAGLNFIDLSTPVARRVAHLPVEVPGSSVSCPLWSADGTACVYSELSDDGNQRLRLVRWGEDGPTDPETFYESADGPVPYLIMP